MGSRLALEGQRRNAHRLSTGMKKAGGPTWPTAQKFVLAALPPGANSRWAQISRTRRAYRSGERLLPMRW